MSQLTNRSYPLLLHCQVQSFHRWSIIHCIKEKPCEVSYNGAVRNAVWHTIHSKLQRNKRKYIAFCIKVVFINKGVFSRLYCHVMPQKNSKFWKKLIPSLSICIYYTLRRYTPEWSTFIIQIISLWFWILALIFI